ncbi:MAG: hypothetical protein M0P69_20265 [Bacteroidales bacterium]|jgi:hypothetical protein|nr:hypothetical protein [Bacteroidales bacterium]
METVFVVREEGFKVIGTIPVKDNEVVVVMKGIKSSDKHRCTVFFDFTIQDVKLKRAGAVVHVILIPNHLCGFKFEDLTICG